LSPIVWSPDHPRIEDGLPKALKRLLNIIARPPRSAITSSGGGTLTPEQVAAKLAALDVTGFDSNDKWFVSVTKASVRRIPGHHLGQTGRACLALAAMGNLAKNHPNNTPPN